MFRKGCLFDIDTISCKAHRSETLRLVLMLNDVCPFLKGNETAENFCQEFDFGSVVEYYRGLFTKKRIWWCNGSFFESGWKFGLPAQMKPHLNILGLRLSKGKEKDAHSLPAIVFDCRLES